MASKTIRGEGSGEPGCVTVREWTSDAGFRLSVAWSRLRRVKRQTRAQWEKLVTEVERGRPLDEVAARAGVRPKTLVWWRWNLRGPRPKLAAAARAKSPPCAAPSLLPVLVSGFAAPPLRARLRLELGNAALVFEDDSAPEYIAALARALAAC